MRRREFLGVLGGAAAVWPFVARAQTTIPVIGYLSGRSAELEAPLREPFLKSLEEAGFVVGRNFTIEYRHSQGHDDRLPELASELVRRQVAVLVATSNTSALAAKAATSTIPIVFGGGDDPVRLGLVASLNRPGGNATGVYVFTSRLGAKRLSLIRALAAQARLDRIRRQSKEHIHGDPGRGNAASGTRNRPAAARVARRKRGRGRGGVRHHGAAKSERCAVRSNGVVSGHQ